MPTADAPVIHLGRSDIYLAGELSPEDQLTLILALRVGQPHCPLLIDSSKASACLRATIADMKAGVVRPIGGFPMGVKEVEQRLGVPAQAIRTWGRVDKADLWMNMFPKAAKVVLCPAAPRGQLLQAACLAGVLKAPLVVCNGTTKESQRLRQKLRDWETRDLYVVGNTAGIAKGFDDVRLHRLKDESAVQTAYLSRRLAKGKVRTLVITNPADLANKQAGMSTFAPWITLEKKGLLLLTNAAGDNVN